MSTQPATATGAPTAPRPAAAKRVRAQPVLDKAVRHGASLIEKRRQRRAGDVDRIVRSLAKRLAQEASAGIGNRKLRAYVRTRYYNQVAPLLLVTSSERVAERVRYRKALLLAAGASVLLAAALVWLLVRALL